MSTPEQTNESSLRRSFPAFANTLAKAVTVGGLYFMVGSAYQSIGYEQAADAVRDAPDTDTAAEWIDDLQDSMRLYQIGGAVMTVSGIAVVSISSRRERAAQEEQANLAEE